MTYSACVELLFADESSDIADRIRRARAAGFTAVEFWRWRDKDLAAIGAALRETGAALEAILVEPKASLVDPDQHAAFLGALSDTARTAERLGAAAVIAQVGQELVGVERAEHSVTAMEEAHELAAGERGERGDGREVRVDPLDEPLRQDR